MCQNIPGKLQNIEYFIDLRLPKLKHKKRERMNALKTDIWRMKTGELL